MMMAARSKASKLCSSLRIVLGKGWVAARSHNTSANSPRRIVLMGLRHERQFWRDGNLDVVGMCFLVGILVCACETDSDSSPGEAESTAGNSDQSVTIPRSSFSDVTAEAGLAVPQIPDVDARACQQTPFRQCGLEAPLFTGGAAVADYDNDGDADIFLPRFEAPSLLFRNRGDGSFEEVGMASGLGEIHRASGAAWLDIENDGDLDLYILTVGEPRYFFYLNLGDGTFREEAHAHNLDFESPEIHQGFSIATGDFDRDGYVDLHINEWQNDLKYQTTNRARLLHNIGQAMPGVFEDVTEQFGVNMFGIAPGNVDEDEPVEDNLFGVSTFTSTFTDLDRDGWPDLVVAADFGKSRLFWNVNGNSFIDGTDVAGVGTDENGMGSAIGDFDGNGQLDWFVTAIFCDLPRCEDGAPWPGGVSGNRLYLNQGDRRFEDATDAAHVRDAGWGWGTTAFDSDNDGDLDLAATNGVTISDVLFRPYYDDQMRYWENLGAGIFKDKSTEAGLDDRGDGKGMVHLDYDGDGDLDLLIVNHVTGPLLYRNDLPTGHHWLRLKLEGTQSNAQALGTWVELVRADGVKLVRELRGAGQYLGQSEQVLHFGLGKQDTITSLQIIWPNGMIQEVIAPGIDRVLEIVEGLAP